MNLLPTLFKEVFILKPEFHTDIRGSFSEQFNSKVFEKVIEKKTDT